MAFTGNATVTSLGKYVARITGITLGAGAAGTIGFATDAGADVKLPAQFPTVAEGRTDEVDAGSTALSLSDLVEASVHVGAGNKTGDIRISKGTNPFRITLTNASGNTATDGLEVYVRYHHSAVR